MRAYLTKIYEDFSVTVSSHILPFTIVLIIFIMTIEEKKRKKAEYDREYRKRNKEKIAERQRNWYIEHKENKRQYDVVYRQEHVESRKNVKAKWNVKNKKKMSDYNKEYYNTLVGMSKRRRNHYVYEDKNMGFDTAKTVSDVWILEHILTDNRCIYCGDTEPLHLGCDRINNCYGHSEDNIVCACPICNWERSLEHMTVEEFIEYRKTHPRFKERMNDGLDRKTGERKPLKKKKLPYEN